jgi:hypothetical protein
MILFFVLYGCETWFLVLREEHRLRVYANLRERKWQEDGEDYIMRSFINFTLHKIVSG